jgi:plastocyanin
MLTRIAVLALAAGLVACGGDDDNGTGPDPAPSSLTVTTPTQPPPRFIPATGRVAVGGEVTWTNGSPEGVIHDITSDNGAWTTTTLDPGESFSVTFDEAGSYTYRCALHAGMTGVIHVED